MVRLVRGGRYEGDVIMPAADEVVRNGCLHENIISFNVNNLNGKKMGFQQGEEAFVLLKPVMAGGRLVSGDKNRSLDDIRKAVKENLSKLDPAYKRLVNPHIYGVGLKQDLYSQQKNMVAMFMAQREHI